MILELYVRHFVRKLQHLTKEVNAILLSRLKIGDLVGDCMNCELG